MIRLIWTRTAVLQLSQVRELHLRRDLYFAVEGLRNFPQKGRLAPEASCEPKLGFAGELRELIFPKVFRLFYLYDPQKQEIHIMGVAFHGQQVDTQWLSKLLSD